ncbi:MAG: transcriptional regulator [Bacilli bacterium]|nr:transcriptional regulator [Bacilli bacterium]
MLNNNIKYCREEIEMTQEELGYIFGVTGTTVSGWENNNDTMPLPKMVKFANMYHFSLDYITGLSRKNKYQVIRNLDKKEVGNKLKKIRKKLNLTQKQIADECMITQQSYSLYENGKTLVTSLVLYTICFNHKLSMDNILK